MVKRIRQGKNSTLSEIYVEGEFCCYGLEDAVREYKIKGSTAIPAGTYLLGLNTYGGMNARYARQFADLHRGMLEIKGIPHYSYVYLHIGNTYADTSGCILVGEGYMYEEEDYVLTQSKKAYKKLYQRLSQTMAAVQVEITISPL